MSFKVKIEVSSHVVLKDFHLLEKDYPSIIGSLKQRCTYKNQLYVNNEKYGYSNATVPEYLYTYRMVKSDLVFNRGLYKVVLRTLANFGISFDVETKTFKGHEANIPESKVTFRDKQQNAIEVALKKKQGILILPTSFGKTLTALEIIRRTQSIGTVVVHTTFLQKQWIKEATEVFGVPKNLIGGCGGIFKKPRLGQLNICLYQTLQKENVLSLYTKITGCLICDETQKVAINQFLESVNRFPALYRIGVSASIKRKDEKETLIKDTLGDVILKEEEEASDSKILSKITIVNTTYFDYDYDWDKNHVDLVNRISESKERNTLILKRCVAQVNLGKQVMIIVERKKQAFILQNALEKKGVRTKVLAGLVTEQDLKNIKNKDARDNANNYDEEKAYDLVKKLAEEKKIDVIIGTQKAEVGLSIRTINHLIISTLATSNVEDRLNQIIGRCERTHGKELESIFGIKPQPTVDLLMDTKFKHINRQKKKVKEFYKGRITEIFIKND